MPSIKKSNNSDKLVLTVTPRTVFGKKLNRLRKEGNVPANIYGPDFKSQAVTASTKDFLKTFKSSKTTGVVYLLLDKQELPVLIKNVQRHPVGDFILHADLRKIDLKQKIQTAVPIKVIGQSEAVTQKGGVLLTQAETLLVEALPTDIPKEIEVDISSLKETGQEIKVADLKKSALYEIKDLATKIILSVVAHKEESITPETAPSVAPEVLTTKPEEGEVAAEGEAAGTESGKPAAGKAPETKPSSAKTTGGKTSQSDKSAEGKK